MTHDEATALFQRLLDGQEITVQVASGRAFTGIYDGGQTDPETFLYFETMDGHPLRAEWQNVTSVSPRGGRGGVAGQPLIVPPEHPYAQRTGKRVPYTARNTRGME